ncbi:TonB-dependent siderophore receptor [Ferrovibrio sp.]|uniref:TonB-dependent siderophore receptor n=1 Tax=Ferrovibrio sp. TaxID=1917215 RepID=UPI003514981D
MLLGSALVAISPAPALAGEMPVSGVQVVAQADQGRVRFSIPAQGLENALNQFGRQAGLQVTTLGALAAGLRSPGVSGTFTPAEALDRLLAGTGLTYRFTDAGTVALSMLPQGSGPVELPPVNVQGRRGTETAWGPADGYVAQRSASGTKTDTPLSETPQSVSVVTRAQLDEQKPRQISEALRYTAGVRSEAGGLQMQHDGIQIRGFTQYAGYLYRDGTRETPGAYLGFHAPEPYNLERVEVIKGPASVLYGQSSPGGLVNLVTKRPGETPVNEVEVQGGSFERKQVAADIGGALADRVSYRLVALARDSGTQVDHVDDNRAFIAGGLTFRPGDDTTITLLLDHQRDDSLYLYGMPAAGTALSNANGKIPLNRFLGEPDFDSTYLNKTSFSALSQHHLDEAWTFRQTLRFSDHDYDSKTLYVTGLQANQRIANRNVYRRLAAARVFTADNQVEAKFETGPVGHTALAGFDYQHASLDVMTATGTGPTLDLFSPSYGAAVSIPAFNSGNDQKVAQYGFYAQDQLRYGDWILVLGGRQDRATTETYNRFTAGRTEQDDRAFTGRAGLMYQFDFGLVPYVSYAESFEPVSGTAFGGKPFDPETGRQKEIGFKFQPKDYNSFITVSAFDLQRQNVTTSDPVNTGFSVQTGEVSSRGLEFEGKAGLADGLDLIATYTYIDSEVTRSNGTDLGKRPVQSPAHMASVWADYTIRSGDFAGFGIGGGLRYIGDTYGDSTNSFEVSGFTLVDAALHYDWNSLRFSLNAANLFDKENLSCRSSTGCTYGAGRTVIGAVRYRW